MLHDKRSAQAEVDTTWTGSGTAWAGILTVGALTVLALWVGARLPLFGSAVSGMVLGLVLRNVFHIGGQFTQITGFCTKRLLKTAIVLLGSTFTLQQAALLGQKYLIVIVTTIAITLAAAYLAGRSCGVPRSLAGLIGAGTAICGATAILTVSPVVQARDEEVTYALSTVFLFNLVAMLLYPLVGHFVSMKEAAFGAWAGSAIHDTSSVLAAAFAYGDEAGKVATVVKLTRTLFLVPLVAGFSLAFVRRSRQTDDVLRGVGAAFPGFVVAFVGMSMLSSAGVISQPVAAALGQASKLMITLVLVAVGLSSDLGRVRHLGLRPLLIGLVTSVVVAVTGFWLLTGVLG